MGVGLPLSLIHICDYIHVVDLARGHVAACNYLMQHSGCEVFNLGTGTGYSVLDLVHTCLLYTSRCV